MPSPAHPVCREYSLAVDPFQACRSVPFPGYLRFRNSSLQLLHLVRCQFDRPRRRILLSVISALRPWNRHDVFALRHYSCQRELTCLHSPTQPSHLPYPLLESPGPRGAGNTDRCDLHPAASARTRRRARAMVVSFRFEGVPPGGVPG